MFTKEQYLAWKASRSDAAAQWQHADCRDADAHIRSEALIAARNWAKANVPAPAREYLNLMIRCHYGSAETDAFLQQIKAYPDWM